MPLRPLSLPLRFAAFPSRFVPEGLTPFVGVWEEASNGREPLLGGTGGLDEEYRLWCTAAVLFTEAPRGDAIGNDTAGGRTTRRIEDESILGLQSQANELFWSRLYVVVGRQSWDRTCAIT